MNAINPGSDPIYKRLYSFPEMVADLLRSVLPAETLNALNLQSLEKVPASYVGEDFRQRHGDTVWRVQAAGEDGPWAYMLVLLEFQSSNDATMALRVTEYTTMLYRELLRAKAAEPEDRAGLVDRFLRAFRTAPDSEADGEPLDQESLRRTVAELAVVMRLPPATYAAGPRETSPTR